MAPQSSLTPVRLVAVVVALLVGLDVGMYHLVFEDDAGAGATRPRASLRRRRAALDAALGDNTPRRPLADLRAAIADLRAAAETATDPGAADDLWRRVAALRLELRAAVTGAADNRVAAPLGSRRHPPAPPAPVMMREDPPRRVVVEEAPRPPPSAPPVVVRPDSPSIAPPSSLHPPPPRVDASSKEAASEGAALGSDSVLLMICHSRAAAVKRSMRAVVKHHPCGAGPRVVISQDGGASTATMQVRDEIARAAEALAKRCPSLAPLRHVVHTAQTTAGDGYHKLSRHYKFAFSSTFGAGAEGEATNRVVVIEEDLEVAPDFFEYFGALAPVLDADPTLMAVSAWNDNGQTGTATDETRVLRSDFFPGLGWMLTRKLWVEELESKWPEAYWDDWLREPPQRRGRHFLRPEVCRTYHFQTQTGVSHGQYGRFLQSIKLNNAPTTRVYYAFGAHGADLAAQLEMKAYDAKLLRDIQAAELVRDPDEVKRRVGTGAATAGTAVRLEYPAVEDFSPRNFPGRARALGVMDNVKAGVPRTAYRGVVQFWYKGAYVFLTPPLADLERSLSPSTSNDLT